MFQTRLQWTSSRHFMKPSTNRIPDLRLTKNQTETPPMLLVEQNPTDNDQSDRHQLIPNSPVTVQRHCLESENGKIPERPVFSPSNCPRFSYQWWQSLRYLRPHWSRKYWYIYPRSHHENPQFENQWILWLGCTVFEYLPLNIRLFDTLSSRPLRWPWENFPCSQRLLHSQHQPAPRQHKGIERNMPTISSTSTYKIPLYRQW